jgi:hypothetical protein
MKLDVHEAPLDTIREEHTKSLIEGLAEQRQRLEYLIGITPTGPVRNSFCDANIHVNAALNAIKD